MDKNSFSFKRLVLNTSCYILLFLVLSSFGVIFYHFIPNPNIVEKPNIAEGYLFSRAMIITNREIIVSNRNFSVQYQFPTNTIPYDGGSNVHILIKDATIKVDEIVGINTNKIDGTMKGIIPLTGGLNSNVDRYYVLRANGWTNGM